MISISIRNSYSYVSKEFNILPKPVQNYIIKETSYQKQARQRFQITTVYLFQKKALNPTNTKYYQFPTGLIYKVIKLFKENNVEYKLIDERGKKPEQYPLERFYKKLKKIDSTIEERDYQQEAIEVALKRSRGIISHSTASGKSIIIAGITYCVNVKTLILCVGKDHVNQLSTDLAKYTDKFVTLITGGICDARGDIVVSNAQALNALKVKNIKAYKELMQKFGCIIGDEIHRAASKIFKEPFYFCVNAYYKFGASGTVHREDGTLLEIIAAVGPVISKVDYTFLTKRNYISPARFLFIDPMCRSLYGIRDEWPNCLNEGIVQNEQRNKWIARICKVYEKRGSQVLIISPFRIEHGKNLHSLIPNSVYLSGESFNEERIQGLESFRNKEFNVLISSNIFDEVINLPDVRCVINAGGGKAQNRIYQRIGRGIRKSEGKSHVDIIIPWDSHSSILLKHSKKIKQLIMAEPAWRDNIKMIGKYRKLYEG